MLSLQNRKVRALLILSISTTILLGLAYSIYVCLYTTFLSDFTMQGIPLSKAEMQSIVYPIMIVYAACATYGFVGSIELYKKVN